MKSEMPAISEVPTLESVAPEGISYVARLSRAEFERRYAAMPANSPHRMRIS